MTETPVPEWASGELRRHWPTLSEFDRCAIIADHDADLLRRAAAQLRGTALDRSATSGDFTIDGLQDDGCRWHAVAFGEPWNGWATPIVNRATLQNLIADLAEIDGHAFGEIRSNDELVVYGEETEDNYLITPNKRGEYALFSLGWCFLVCD